MAYLYIVFHWSQPCHNQGVSSKGWRDNHLSSPSGSLHGHNCLEHAQTFTFSPVELSLFESVRHELGLTITNSKTIKYYTDQQLLNLIYSMKIILNQLKLI